MYMKSKKTLKKNNKTKRNKKYSALTDEVKSIIDVISEFTNKSDNNKVNEDIINYFLKNNTKKSNYLIKNDFYSYINDFWLHEFIDKNQMKYLIKLDDIRITQFKVNTVLNELVLNYVKNNNNIVSLELKNCYDSVIKFNSVESSKNYMKKIVNEIDLLRKDKNNLWKMLAIINKLDLTNPFGPFYLEFGPDQRDMSKYVYYLNPHNFAIFDLNVYKDKSYSDKKDEYLKKYKDFFTNYLTKLFKITLPHDNSVNSDDTFSVGRSFFNIMMSEDKNGQQSAGLYNKITSDEALNKYNFNWVEYCKGLGYESNNIPEYFVVTDLNFFKRCTELLINEWNSDKWRSYWLWLYARFVSRLTEKWHDVFFDFYGKLSQGLEESLRKTKTHSAMLFCAYAFNPLLNNLYLAHNYNEQNIVFTTNLANNLKQIFIDKIKRNTWMDDKTKKYAILKIQKIELQIGSKKMPDNYNEILPLLNFNPDEFIENVIKISEWRNNLRINNKINIVKTIADVNFTTYPLSFYNLASYTVNARYNKLENILEISSSYLQKPFINISEYGTEYNLALIGFTIAHELSHSLSNIGKKSGINKNGVYKVSDKDRVIFNNIEKQIIKQYNIFSKFDNLNYDATNTIKEDIADISGLSLCEEYLRDFCIQHNYSPLLILLHFKMFYSYYAYQMRQKITKQGVKFELIKNVHPIDKYRTNVSLSRSRFFQGLFNIKKGDKMYWKDTDPIF